MVIVMKKTTESVTLSTDHNHRPIGFEVIEYDSEKPGPHVFMQASVHGAELQGNMVIQVLMEKLEKEDLLSSGKITIIPFANPWGTTELFGAGTYGRFDPITGKNWNRAYHYLYDEKLYSEFAAKKEATTDCVDSFKQLQRRILTDKIAQAKDYGIARASQLTYELQKRSIEADIFLDLHTAPHAGLYLYAPDYLKEKACDLRYPINLIIPPEFADAGDEAHFSPWVKLREHFAKENKVFDIPIESYTLELGGEEIINRDLATTQLKHITNYLAQRGVLKSQSNKELPKGVWQELKHFKTYYAPHGGLCEYLAKPLEKVEAGKEFARVSYYNHEAGSFNSTPLMANSPSIVVNYFSTSNVQLGTEVYQVLENPLNY
jgi:predicted deacylase